MTLQRRSSAQNDCSSMPRSRPSALNKIMRKHADTMYKCIYLQGVVSTNPTIQLFKYIRRLLYTRSAKAKVAEVSQTATKTALHHAWQNMPRQAQSRGITCQEKPKAAHPRQIATKTAFHHVCQDMPREAQSSAPTANSDKNCIPPCVPRHAKRSPKQRTHDK